jgi:thioredoxin 1
MNAYIKEINDASFSDLVERSEQLVLLDFWASWCVPCKQLAPLIDELAAMYEGCVLVGKVDTEANPELCKRFQIVSIPTLILMKDGKELKRLAERTKTRLAAVLDSHL